MIFSRSKEPERVEHRRPCEVDGSKAWYHGLVHADRTMIRLEGNQHTRQELEESVRAIRLGYVLPSDCQMHVERRTYAMVEYLDGSVEKVDPEQVHFIDV